MSETKAIIQDCNRFSTQMAKEVNGLGNFLGTVDIGTFNATKSALMNQCLQANFNTIQDEPLDIPNLKKDGLIKEGR